MKLRPDPHLLTGAYALDAVDDAERDRIQRHLARCPACAQEARGLREAATRMALAAAEPPPPQLREKVMAAVAQTRQQAPAGESGVTTRPAAAWRRRAWMPRLAAVAMSVAVLAVIGLAVAQVVTQSRLNTARAQQAALSSVLAAPDARTATARVQNGGTVTVVYSQDERRMIFTADGLPPLHGGKVYELWLMAPKSNRPAGLLDLQSGGRTTPVIASGLRAGDQTGLTVEPAGGSAQPTTTPIVVVPLTG
ncbi:MAG TPA: anti-sigma factor [Streptosporangiaceae bacterium]|jgi:anti-sigma factor ChrR (cupin superfamily)|nr:anti-sigma factor [Streptosporangiaceae bacterium]